MRDLKQIMRRIGSKFAKTNWRDWRSLRFSLRGHLDPQKRLTNGDDPREGVEEMREGERGDGEKRNCRWGEEEGWEE